MNREFLDRQIDRMLSCITEYKNQNMSIDRLYGNLNFLYLNLVSENIIRIDDVLEDSINNLEILNTGLIENLIDYNSARKSAMEAIKIIEEQVKKLIQP
jgi:hypothetical protein